MTTTSLKKLIPPPFPKLIPLSNLSNVGDFFGIEFLSIASNLVRKENIVLC